MNLYDQGIQKPEVASICRKCISPKPQRTHHCSVCDRCVLAMDHHCPWLNNCVGYYNARSVLLRALYLQQNSYNYRRAMFKTHTAQCACNVHGTKIGISQLVHFPNMHFCQQALLRVQFRMSTCKMCTVFMIYENYYLEENLKISDKLTSFYKCTVMFLGVNMYICLFICLP